MSNFNSEADKTNDSFGNVINKFGDVIIGSQKKSIDIIEKQLNSQDCNHEERKEIRDTLTSFDKENTKRFALLTGSGTALFLTLIVSNMVVKIVTNNQAELTQMRLD